MNEKNTISPELGSGFKDYLPEDMIPRQKMFDTIRSTFERFGFVPLDTPGIEREEILTGGDPNFKMQIFRTGGVDRLKEVSSSLMIVLVFHGTISFFSGFSSGLAKAPAIPF